MNDIDKIKAAVEELNIAARALGVLNKLYQTHRIEHGEYCTYMDVILGVPSKKRQVAVFDIQKPSALTPEGEAFGKAMAGEASGPEVAPLQQYGAKPKAPRKENCRNCEDHHENLHNGQFYCTMASKFIDGYDPAYGCLAPEWCPRFDEKKLCRICKTRPAEVGKLCKHCDLEQAAYGNG